MNPNDYIEHSGGRAGLHEFGWLRAGYDLDEVESIRQTLLRQNEVGKVQQALQKLGIYVRRDIIQAVKNYNFDSQGIAFTHENYTAWRRLVTERGTLADAAYLVHEMAEVEALQKIKQTTGFDFMGQNWNQLSSSKQQEWKSDFRRRYLPSHSQALKAEYEFIADKINEITKGKAKVSFLQVAAIDPTRNDEALTNLFFEGVPIFEHHHFETWSKRANEEIALSARIQQQLGYYLQKTTLKNIIRLVKSMRIN